MIITREWALPSANTFSIPPITRLLKRYVTGRSVDPFANTSRIATVTNDINPYYKCDHSMDAIEFLATLEAESFDCVLLDPPYSRRQVSDHYKAAGVEINGWHTGSGWNSTIKRTAANAVKLNGYVVSMGWNSNGVGTKNGCRLVELLIVAHGGDRHDTLVTVEKKVRSQGTLFPA